MSDPKSTYEGKIGRKCYIRELKGKSEKMKKSEISNFDATNPMLKWMAQFEQERFFILARNY